MLVRIALITDGEIVPFVQFIRSVRINNEYPGIVSETILGCIFKRKK